MTPACKIIGGSSTAGEITLMSDRYISTARWTKDGTIETHLSKQAKVFNVLHRIKFLPVPRLLLLALSIFLGAPILNGICLAISILSLTIRPAQSPWSVTVSSTTLYMLVAVLAFITGLTLVLINRYVGTWHGAEHMACAAYRTHQKTDLETIVQQNRVDDWCGGRFALPFLTTLPASFFVANIWHISFGLTSLIMIEGLLWIDHWWGLGKIPLTRHASQALQRHITTRQPGIAELQTAQAALENLVAAHTEFNT